MRIAWNVIRETGCKRPTFCIVSRRIDSSTLECTSRRMIPCFPYYRILSLVWAIVPLLPPFNVNVLLGRLPPTWVIIVKYVVAFESRVVEFRYCVRLVILFFYLQRIHFEGFEIIERFVCFFKFFEQRNFKYKLNLLDNNDENDENKERFENFPNINVFF